jgi:mRNA interferase RelE/StbE
MSYELAILPEAEKEWQQLDGSVRQLFKKQLQKCLRHPRIPKNQLSGYNDYYKIKLTHPQYRLVYHVDDEHKRLTIIAVGSRQAIYEIWLRLRYPDKNGHS